MIPAQEGLALGVVLGSTVPPEELVDCVRIIERSGFSEIWATEDYFFTGGISTAALALASAENLRVGLGVLPIYGRHPAVLAMEVSTLAGAFPGRLMLGLGIGVRSTIDQLGLGSRSPMRTVAETLTSIRELLAGRTLDQSGTYQYRDVALTYPPAHVPPLMIGAVGPKMLAQSGRIADGTVLSILVGPEYVRRARGHIETGMHEVGRPSSAHRLTTYALLSVDDDPGKARDVLRPTVAHYLGNGGTNPLTDAAGISEQLAEIVEEDGVSGLEESMPDEWIDALCICGSVRDCALKIQALFDAGSDAVALMLTPDADLAPVLGRLGEHVRDLRASATSKTSQTRHGSMTAEGQG